MRMHGDTPRCDAGAGAGADADADAVAHNSSSERRARGYSRNEGKERGKAVGGGCPPYGGRVGEWASG